MRRRLCRSRPRAARTCRAPTTQARAPNPPSGPASERPVKIHPVSPLAPPLSLSRSCLRASPRPRPNPPQPNHYLTEPEQVFPSNPTPRHGNATRPASRLALAYNFFALPLVSSSLLLSLVAFGLCPPRPTHPAPRVFYSILLGAARTDSTRCARLVSGGVADISPPPRALWTGGLRRKGGEITPSRPHPHTQAAERGAGASTAHASGAEAAACGGAARGLDSCNERRGRRVVVPVAAAASGACGCRGGARWSRGEGAQLRGRAAEEPALLRGAAVGAPPAQPARRLAPPLRPHRRPRARGGLGGRLLRRRRPCQVRAPHGVHGDDAVVEPNRVRRRRRGGRRAGTRARGHQVGHRLLHQGPHQARRALGRGGRRRHGPLLLAAAGGHDDVAAGVQGRPGPPGLGRRRRDGGGHGRRLHRLPRLQPALRAPPSAPRPAAVRVRRQVQGQIRQQHRGGEELLRVGERVQGRAPLGRPVAPPRHRPVRLPRLRRRQRPLLRRHRLGHQRVQLGRQVRRRPDPGNKAAAARGARAAPPEHPGAVQGQGGALRVRVPWPEHGRRRGRQRGAEPRRDALHPAVEQHAVRDQRGVPALGLLRLPGRGRGRGVRRRGGRGGGGGVRARQGAGGLRAGHQPEGGQLPGRVRRQVPQPGAPPGRVHRAVQAQQGVHRVHAGVRPLVRPPELQPQRARRSHRRRAGPAGQVQGQQGQLHADGGVHVQHGPDGRHVRQAAPDGAAGAGTGIAGAGDVDGG